MKHTASRFHKIKRYLGFSYLAISVLVCFFILRSLPEQKKWEAISYVPAPIRKAGRIALREIQNFPYLFVKHNESSLPQWNLSIDPENFHLLYENIPATGQYLTNDKKKFVPGKFYADGNEYTVQVSLRGRSRDNWEWPKKSLAVMFPDDASFLGMKNIDLTEPIARNYLVDAFINRHAEKLGLPFAKGSFVVVRVNNLAPAVYWQTEHFDAYFLETKQLSSDSNLYVEKPAVDDLYMDVFAWDKYTSAATTPATDRTDLDFLLALLHHPDDEYFYQSIFSILDAENFYAWSIHNTLFFGQHQGGKENMRLYFDPSLGKFIMIPWDVSIRDAEEIAGDEYIFEAITNPLSNRILKNPEFLKERNGRMWEYLEQARQIDYELSYYDELFESVRTDFYRDTIRRYSNLAFDNEVARYRDIIKRNFERLYSFFSHAHIQLEAAGQQKNDNILVSKTLSPISVDYLRIEAREVQKNSILILVDGRQMKCLIEAQESQSGTSIYVCPSLAIEPKVIIGTRVVDESLKGKDSNYSTSFKVGENRTELYIELDNEYAGDITLGVKNMFTKEITEVRWNQP